MHYWPYYLALLPLLATGPASAEERPSTPTANTPVPSTPESRPADEIQQPGASLFWLRCPVGQTWNGTSCEGAPKRMTWQDAQKACPEGYRVPALEEYKTLLGGCSDLNGLRCSTCGSSRSCSSMFGNDTGWYWSSSSYAYDTAYAWFVYFGDGRVRYGDKYGTNYARCVRGGP